jgi:hypothetical protein
MISCLVSTVGKSVTNPTVKLGAKNNIRI